MAERKVTGLTRYAVSIQTENGELLVLTLSKSREISIPENASPLVKAMKERERKLAKTETHEMTIDTRTGDIKFDGKKAALWNSDGSEFIDENGSIVGTIGTRTIDGEEKITVSLLPSHFGLNG